MDEDSRLDVDNDIIITDTTLQLDKWTATSYPTTQDMWGAIFPVIHIQTFLHPALSLRATLNRTYWMPSSSLQCLLELQHNRLF